MHGLMAGVLRVSQARPQRLSEASKLQRLEDLRRDIQPCRLLQVNKRHLNVDYLKARSSRSSWNLSRVPVKGFLI